MKTLLAALALASHPVDLPPLSVTPSPRPDVILSGIRLIHCDKGSGSGFVIAENVLATALHVARLGNCYDASTKKPLTTYYSDKEHDFALMVGSYPELIAMKYSCEGYETGNRYDAYGISGHFVNTPIFRQYKLVATQYYSGVNFLVGGMTDDPIERIPVPGMRELRGFLVPGLSGGPIAKSDTGVIVGMNNVGRTLFGDLIVNVSHSFELKNTILCKR